MHKHDLVSTSLSLPHNISASILWITGDLYVQNLNLTFTIEARNKKKEKLKDLFVVSLKVNGMADLSLKNLIISGVLHFFKIIRS